MTVSDPHRILLIRPSALGDVCRTVPVLASLKRRWPEAEIDWLVQDSFAPAITAHPDLSAAVPFPRGEFGRGWWRRPGAVRQATRWGRSLRARDYDMVFDCQGLARSGLFAWSTRAPARIGFADARELGWVGLTRRRQVPTGMHTVDRMLGLLRAEGIPIVHDMRLYTSASDRDSIHPRLRTASGFAVVAPTSRWPGKRWPAERFAVLIERLLADGAVGAVAVVGSASERDQCGPISELSARDARVVDLIGRTSVGGLMAVVEASSLVVANDSAALHMGVGFDKPIVALFGPTRVDRVGPYRRDADVIQHLRDGDRFDHKVERNGVAMMVRISVDEVFDRARQALRGGSAVHSGEAQGAG